MIKLKDILLEIGEGSAKPYKWKVNLGQLNIYGTKVKKYMYEWETDSGLDYILELYPLYTHDAHSEKQSYFVSDQGMWTANFGPYKPGEQLYGIDGKPIGTPEKDVDYEIETNKGDLFNIMATIVDAMKDFIKQAKKTDWGVDIIRYEGAKAEGAKSNQRNKLYAAYIKRHLPGATIKKVWNDQMEIHIK